MGEERSLTIGTVLNKKYKIEKVLGEGGFGITYLARDINIDELVAIKEYFPAQIGTRDSENPATHSITLVSKKYVDTYKKGLMRFEEEAATLAKFNGENGIVSVMNFFHENGTGYMVMEYLEGITLKKYLDEKGVLEWNEALDLMKPLMDSLQKAHRAGVIHRDISPDNIIVCNDGDVKLIDFGAARELDNSDKSVSVLLKEGYTPIEQYNSDGKMGPWTDVYSLCATIYRMVTGKKPPESISRYAGEEKLVPVKKCCHGATASFCNAVEYGLEVEVEKRCQSVGELREVFEGKRKGGKSDAGRKSRIVPILIGVAVLLVGFAGIYFGVINKKLLFGKTTGQSGGASDAILGEVIYVPTEKYMYATKTSRVYSSKWLSGSYYLYGDSAGRSYAYIEKGKKYKILDSSNDIVKIDASSFEFYSMDKYTVDSETGDKIFERYTGDIYLESGIFIPEEDYELFTEYYQKINDAAKDNLDELICKHAFEDFDGDNEKELVVLYFVTSEDNFLKRSDNSSLQHYDSYIAFADKDKVCVDNKLIKHTENLYEIEILTVGKEKIISLDYQRNSGYIYAAPYGLYYCVADGGLKRIAIGDDSELIRFFNFGDGVAFIDYDTYTFYDTNGARYDLVNKWNSVQDGSFYPIVVSDGKFEQIAYTSVDVDEFREIPGADYVLEEFWNYLDWSDVAIEEHISETGILDMKIAFEDITVDNVLYNDVGVFAVNYIAEAQFYEASYNRKKSTVEYGEKYDVISTNRLLEEQGSVQNFLSNNTEIYNRKNIDKLAVCAYFTYEDGKFKLVSKRYGYQDFSTDKLEIRTISSFDGIAY